MPLIFVDKMGVVTQDMPHHVFSLVDVQLSGVDEVSSLEIYAILKRNCYLLERSLRLFGLVLGVFVEHGVHVRHCVLLVLRLMVFMMRGQFL